MKRSQIDKAIAALEQDKAVLDLAIATLKAQQAAQSAQKWGKSKLVRDVPAAAGQTVPR